MSKNLYNTLKIRKVLDIAQNNKASRKYRTISIPSVYVDGYGWLIGNKKSLKK